MYNPFKPLEMIKAEVFMSMPAKFRKKSRTAWSDPNRQGADEGTQYRSIVLYHNEAQRVAAAQSKAAAASKFSRPIVTEVVSLERFYPAEAYHQDYFRKNPHAGYCQVVIAPKLKKFQAKPGTP